MNIPNAARCYSLTQSVQIPKSMVGPTAGAKLRVVPQDADNNRAEHLVKTDHHDLRQQLVKVRIASACLLICVSSSIQAVAPVAMATLRAGPSEMVETILNQAQVAGVMPVGSADNIAFPAMQLNITATQVADKNAREFL